MRRRLSEFYLRPGYLYRQKYIVGNLENIGYCLPGKECRYNIEIIEEISNVIGLGAGASSKLLKNYSRHENIYNPLDVKLYIERLPEIHKQIKNNIDYEPEY